MSSRWLYPVMTAVACLLLVALSLPALHSFFANDDWLLLNHYGKLPLSSPWAFFSPRVVFFYRPLQALQYGLFYHWFGFDEVPYNVALFLGHLCVCGLTYWMLAELTDRPALATLATVLFASQWYYYDVLLWKANYNTLHWAIFTLAACAAFARWVRTGQPVWRTVCYVFCAIDLLSKESAVTTVILLGLIWLVLGGERQSGKRPDRKAFWRSGAQALWPVAAMAAVYLLLHALFVEETVRLDYPWSPALQWPFNAVVAYNALMTSAYFQLALASQSAAPNGMIGVLTLASLAVPLLVLGYACYKRDRLMLFGLAWVIIAFVPVLFLRDFNSSRYYYLPAVGGALVLGRLFEKAFKALSEKETPASRLVRMVLILAGVTWLAANVVAMQLAVARDAGASDAARAIFRTLRAEKGQVAPGAVVLLRHSPPGYFDKGMGVSEMVKLALDDPSATGIPDGPESANEVRAAHEAGHKLYVLDGADTNGPSLRLID